MKIIVNSVLALSLLSFAGCRPCCEKPAVPHPGHVVFVGFDGWGSAYTDEALKLPNLRRLMAEGSWTMAKRSVLPSSSAVNWASIFMAAGPEQHGYVGWNTTKSVFPPPVTLANGRFPDVFALCRAAEPGAKIGYVYEWDGCAHLIDTNACDFVAMSNRVDAAGLAFLKERKPRLMAFVFDSPDHEGHGSGYGSDAYKRKLESLDVHLGNILAAIGEAGMADDTVVIVTSDHGGVNKGHGGATEAEMLSPFVIRGPGIRRGHAIATSVYAYDIGATMAALLGLEFPSACTGRAIKEVFE